MRKIIFKKEQTLIELSDRYRQMQFEIHLIQ